jgi:hypothetical protein
MSVRLSSWNKSVPIGRIFVKLDFWGFFENLSRNFKFHQNLTRITGTLDEDHCKFCIISRSILLRMKNVSLKLCRETRSTILWSITFFWNCAFYEIMSKNAVEGVMPQMKVWRTSIACWIPKATNTHIQYVILMAFPLQQCLYEHASMLRYT